MCPADPQMATKSFAMATWPLQHHLTHGIAAPQSHPSLNNFASEHLVLYYLVTDLVKALMPYLLIR